VPEPDTVSSEGKDNGDGNSAKATPEVGDWVQWEPKGVDVMTRLPSLEEFADKTDNKLRKVIKGALLRLAPVFRTAKVRGDLLLKQNYRCPICDGANGPLVNNGRETHVDHEWTTDEAANAVLNESMDLISAYKKLWSSENLRAVHRACNFARNKKKTI
jgi:hypothetical protein